MCVLDTASSSISNRVLSVEYTSLLKPVTPPPSPPPPSPPLLADLPLLEHLPVRTVLDLKAIAQYLMSPGGNTDIMSVYAQIRSNQLGRSLNSLKEASQQAQLLPASVSHSFATLFWLLRTWSLGGGAWERGYFYEGTRLPGFALKDMFAVTSSSGISCDCRAQNSSWLFPMQLFRDSLGWLVIHFRPEIQHNFIIFQLRKSAEVWVGIEETSR